MSRFPSKLHATAYADPLLLILSACCLLLQLFWAWKALARSVKGQDHVRSDGVTCQDIAADGSGLQI